VEGLRKLNLGRDQILTRLWELANLSSEATRGIITGRIKVLSMIVAIEGLIPSGMNARRLSPSGTQPAARQSRHKSTRLSGAANNSTKPHVKSQAMPLPPPKPNPPRPTSPSLLPSRPQTG
jgi:hypothetical protein